jgi:hypothetical protein
MTKDLQVKRGETVCELIELGNIQRIDNTRRSTSGGHLSNQASAEARPRLARRRRGPAHANRRPSATGTATCRYAEKFQNSP